MRVVSLSSTLHWIRKIVPRTVRVDKQNTLYVQANTYFTFLKHKRILKSMKIYSVIFINIIIEAFVLDSKCGGKSCCETNVFQDCWTLIL